MKLTIGRRIVGLTLMLAAAMMAVSAVGGLSMKRGSDAAAGFIDHEFALQHGLGQLHVALLQARRHEKDLMIGMNDAATVQAELEAWNEARAHAAKLLAAMGAKVEASQHKQALAKASGHLDTYVASFQSVAKRVQAEAFDNPSAAATLMKRVEADFQQVERIVLDASAILNQRSVELRERLAGEQRSALALFAAVALAAIAAALLVGLHTARSIVRPLRQAVRAAREVAAGDLSASISSERRADEIGELQAALAEMLQQLRRIIGEVRAAGGQIGTASSEIALGNGDLSGRTEQQAASLQQTASSMQQLAVTVGSNAESARQANQLALSASEVAQRGGAVVGQVVATMGEISDGSRRIADIIGVIDGIAFQTNILALNAAVEAARAGEAGRGFAVVAGEVRGLAQQSADAARQIKALIEASVSKVESGSRLVQDAGATMREIVASVQRVTDIIGEISAATGEQTGEIGQVSAAMSALDRMTQQNAALVEQSAAAADSLKEQALRLTATIDVFRLSAAAPDASAHAAPAQAAGAFAASASAMPAAPRRAPSSAAPAKAASPAVARPPTSKPTPAAPVSTAPRQPERAAVDAAAAGGEDDWQEF